MLMLVKLCLHVGLMLQCLTQLCVSALIRIIKHKSVRSRKHSLLCIKHNNTACCGKNKKKFPPLPPQFSIITPKHSQQPDPESEPNKSASCCVRNSGVTTVLLHTHQLITTARAAATRHTGPKERSGHAEWLSRVRCHELRSLFGFFVYFQCFYAKSMNYGAPDIDFPSIMHPL